MFKLVAAMKPLSIMDELTRWDDLFTGIPQVRTSKSATDLHEDTKNYYVECDMPGIDRKDVDISLKDGMLTISSNINKEKEKNDKKYIVRERYYSGFSKTLPLYDDVEVDKISANMKDGVLKVILPKREYKDNTKKINIE